MELLPFIVLSVQLEYFNGDVISKPFLSVVPDLRGVRAPFHLWP